MDGFDKCDPDALEDISVEAFLRGCKEKEAAMKAIEKNPTSLSKAVKYVKTSLANQKAIFGSGKISAYSQRQVIFSDTEKSSHNELVRMPQSTCLENELKNLSSLVGKLSNTTETSEKRSERQRSVSPISGYTPNYRSSQLNVGFTPQYCSPPPANANFNRDRSPMQGSNLRPQWYSPNNSQFSPNRGFGQGQFAGRQYSPNRPYQNQSPQYRGQYTGQLRDFTPQQQEQRGQYQGQLRGFTPQQHGFQSSSPQNMNAHRPFYSPEKSMYTREQNIPRPNLGQNKSMSPAMNTKEEMLNQKGSV
ncbi:unnamed protein product [Mytilus coruscus]|uniref:Uncharacterized protein n=1 Tax=Mytilus coruscus TaxID=42192 RepID=A0A6J8DNT7_MYTCO|nr:unnamed protein product [Mytilus coruscus]